MTTTSDMPRFSTHRPGQKRRGTAATEFCVVLPLLITLIVGSVDFGRAIYAYIALSNAARRGAEQAATHKFTSYTEPFWEQQVRQAVSEEMQQLKDFDSDRLSIDISTQHDADGLFLATVEARYRFETIVDWIAVPKSVELCRSVTMRQIR
jgi:hypothetical protein